MNRVEILYILPYVGSLLLSAGVLFYTWRHRSARGVYAYTWYALGQTLWIFGFTFELISPDLGNKLFWDGFQWLATLIILVAFPIFTVQYSEHKLSHPTRMFWLSLTIPAIFALILMTDSLHHWIYPNPSLNAAIPFQELVYDYTFVDYAYSIYGFLVVFWGMSLLVRRLFQVHALYRAQIAGIFLGFLIPVAGSMLSLANVQFAPQRDGTPFSAALGNLIVAWGLIRFRIFEIIPIARDKVVENMLDLVVVLDVNGRVVDANPAALFALNRKSAQVIGQPAEDVFAGWPELLKRYNEIENITTEASVETFGKRIYYEIKSTILEDSQQKYIGRVFVSRDITERVELQSRLQKINEELEERVAQRTLELAEAYDTTLEGWAKALEMRDKETKDHSQRVTDLTVSLAQAIGIQGDDLLQLRRGAVLHDIGKMAIPDEILGKRGPLTIPERQIVERHPTFGYEFLAPIPFLAKALDIPYCHHEHWDGSGYPRGLKGEENPLAARIFSLIDVWDAIQSDRPYNRAWSKEKAIQYLKEESGKQFDPVCVAVFLDLVEQGKI
jgi:PAS domain S-box-containing protein/putative nucleotidyltransferase with HDIG domain